MHVNWKATGLLVIDVGDGIELNIRAVFTPFRHVK